MEGKMFRDEMKCRLLSFGEEEGRLGYKILNETKGLKNITV